MGKDKNRKEKPWGSMKLQKWRIHKSLGGEQFERTVS
jgi:hypothetical protein